MSKVCQIFSNLHWIAIFSQICLNSLRVSQNWNLTKFDRICENLVLYFFSGVSYLNENIKFFMSQQPSLGVISNY